MKQSGVPEPDSNPADQVPPRFRSIAGAIVLGSGSDTGSRAVPPIVPLAFLPSPSIRVRQTFVMPR